MPSILLPLLAATFTPQPPTTVNGHALGTVEDFTTTGPARICFQDMAVTLKRGETAHVEYLGIHDGRLQLVLDNGTFVTLLHGDAFADQREAGQVPMFERDGRRYYRVGGRDSRSYQVFVRREGSDEYRLTLLLSGTGLAGDASDFRVFDRLTFGAIEPKRCDRRFGYGWDGAFWTRPSRDKAR